MKRASVMLVLFRFYAMFLVILLVPCLLRTSKHVIFKV